MFVQDSRLEHWLQSHGIPFVYQLDISYQELIGRWCTTNYGREAGMAVVEDLVIDYAQ